jgi:hypothetical protein
MYRAKYRSAMLEPIEIFGVDGFTESASRSKPAEDPTAAATAIGRETEED